MWQLTAFFLKNLPKYKTSLNYSNTPTGFFCKSDWELLANWALIFYCSPCQDIFLLSWALQWPSLVWPNQWESNKLEASANKNLDDNIIQSKASYWPI